MAIKNKGLALSKVEGFSLAEMVIYIGILVFMLVLVFQVVTSFFRSEQVVKSGRSIENSALVALEKIEREAKGAVSLNVASSTLGTHPGKLILNTTDESGNPRTVEFYLFGGVMRYKENGVDSGALTASSTQVTSLIFHRFATSTVEGVRTSLTLESGTTTNYRTESFYSSALIR